MGGASRGTGIDNVERRTWDTAEYERRARERGDGADSYGTEIEAGDARAVGAKAKREEFERAEDDGTRRAAALKPRSAPVVKDGEVLGRKQVTVNAEDKSQQGGFYCEVCEFVLQDSSAYLDHVNSARHQRALGFGMRIGKSSVGDVKARLEKLKREKELKKSGLAPQRKSAEAEFRERVKAAEREEERAKEEQKAMKKRAKEEARKSAAAEPAEGEDEGIDEEADQMKAMFGFAAFGSS